VSVVRSSLEARADRAADVLGAVFLHGIALGIALWLALDFLDAPRHAAPKLGALATGAGVGTWLWSGRRRLRLPSAVFGGWAGWMLLWVAAGPDRRHLPAIGDRLTCELEAFRAREGRYPARLEEACERVPWNFFGGWQYRLADERDGFELSAGDYSQDGFTTWRTERAGWQWDT